MDLPNDKSLDFLIGMFLYRTFRIQTCKKQLCKVSHDVLI